MFLIGIFLSLFLDVALGVSPEPCAITDSNRSAAAHCIAPFKRAALELPLVSEYTEMR
jgi:hypothetical protein